MTNGLRPLWVGAPMWAHPPWSGRYLSGNRRRALAEYSTWCNSVEGNTTFYAVPSAVSVATWAEQAPADFRFAFKVPRTVTHELRLQRSAHREVARLLRAIEPLGERVGPLQFQLPPSFDSSGLTALLTFIDGLPGGFDWAFEFRHRDFFDRGDTGQRVNEVLGMRGLGRVILDTRPVRSVPAESEAAVAELHNKPKLPIDLESAGRYPVIRVIGADDDSITLAGLHAWVPVVAAWLAEGRSPFVFTHQPQNLRSPELARAFHDAVRLAGANIAALPDPKPPPPPGELPGQTSLLSEDRDLA